MTILRDLFGPGTWGAGGNLVAWVICGLAGLGLAYLFRDKIGPKLGAYWKRHADNGFGDEIEGLKKHLSDELGRHVLDLKAHADKHAQQALDRQDVHAAATEAHITAAIRPPRQRTPSK